MKKLFIIIGLLTLLLGSANTIFCQEIVTGYLKGRFRDKKAEGFVVVFDEKTLQVKKKFSIGNIAPTKIETFQGKAFVMPGGSVREGVIVVDLKTGKTRRVLRNEIIQDIVIDKDGNLYALNGNTQLLIVDNNAVVKAKVKLEEGSIALVKPNKKEGIFIFRNDRDPKSRITTALIQTLDANGNLKVAATYELGFSDLLNPFVVSSRNDKSMYALSHENLFRFRIKGGSIEKLESGIFEEGGGTDYGLNLSANKQSIFTIKINGILNVIDQDRNVFEAIVVSSSEGKRNVTIETSIAATNEKLFINVYNPLTSKISLMLLNLVNKEFTLVNQYETFNEGTAGGIALSSEDK